MPRTSLRKAPGDTMTAVHPAHRPLGQCKVGFAGCLHQANLLEGAVDELNRIVFSSGRSAASWLIVTRPLARDGTDEERGPTAANLEVRTPGMPKARTRWSGPSIGSGGSVLVQDMCKACLT
ncbi:MAG: hypothetical protein ACXVX9_11580, partial [Mycobacteriaceae bacterium]